MENDHQQTQRYRFVWRRLQYWTAALNDNDNNDNNNIVDTLLSLPQPD